MGALSVRTKYMTIVLLSALVVAFESIALESAINAADLKVFAVAAVPPLVGGLTLIGVSSRTTASFTRRLKRNEWAFFATLCGFVSGGVLLWFDSIGRIGASKEALLGGSSSEVLFVVVLSVVFLAERLSRWEILGSCLVVAGVSLVLFDEETMSLTLGLGEIEAILSSLLLAISVVMTTVMLKVHDLTPVSGLELFIPGVFLLCVGVAMGVITWPGMEGLLILLVLGIFPALGLLTYNSGLPKIGASLTSVLFSLTGIMTVGVALLLLAVLPEASLIIPGNLAVALLGGAVAFVGVVLLNWSPESRNPE
ncbi:MAG TPA: DMT family transporter [Thermoplasmata archaeon]